MEVETVRAPWVKGKLTNFTGVSFAALKSTLTKPSGDGIIDLNSEGGVTANALLFKFFGTDTNNENFNIRIYGWAECKGLGTDKDSWELVLLCQLAVTLGNLAGTANCMITATDFEADTIAVTYGDDKVSVDVVSNAADVRGAHIVVDTKGFGLVQVDGDLNNSAVSWNYGYKRI